VRNKIASGWGLRERQRKKTNRTEGPSATAQAPMAGVFRVKGLDDSKVGSE